MSEKRRDAKGRVLREGERQRSDGQYEYRYCDRDGNRHSVYSWKLVATDKLPQGKKQCEALRDIIKQIERDLDDGIAVHEVNKTLNDYFDEYIEMKYELKPSTRANYMYMYNKYVRNDFGKKCISKITYTEVKKYYLSLIKDLGFKPNSMNIINTIIHPVFTSAVRNNVIRFNPATGVMNEIRKSPCWQTSKRHALTKYQQAEFINFVSSSKQYKKWLNLFTVFLGTGCRVGEVVGLRWEDCDFDEGTISINHSLLYRMGEDGKVRCSISTPKTAAGVRIIPMLDEVRKALLDERLKQMKSGFNQMVVDGYSGFIFKNRKGNCMYRHNINSAISRIVDSYNSIETEKAFREKREASYLPKFSVHNLRHTFCTRFCENESNLKIIQEIMGHADITTTMNIYNEVTKEDKISSFNNLQGKIKIS